MPRYSEAHYSASWRLFDLLVEGAATKTLPRGVIRGLQNVLGASMATKLLRAESAPEQWW